MKAGYKTSEFWAMLATAFVGYLVATGKVHPDNQELASDALVEIVNAVCGSATAILAFWKYTHSRQVIKAQEK
jgi:hypothetical protein